jgi:uncharacterized membrane protein YdcZ (DUF606 family)
VACFGHLVALITFFFAGASLIHPHPLPTQKDLAELPWWAVAGGLVGAVQVYAGLTQVNKVGAGPFVGFTVTAALITSLLIDHFGWFRMQPHPLNAGTNESESSRREPINAALRCIRSRHTVANGPISNARTG